MDEQGYCANYIETEQVRGYLLSYAGLHEQFSVIYLAIPFHIIPHNYSVFVCTGNMSQYCDLDACYLVTIHVIKNVHVFGNN